MLALTGFKLPLIINAPLTLVGGIAVPAMLLAYGISLRLGPRPGSGEPPIQIATLVSIKLVVQPITAYLIGATPWAWSVAICCRDRDSRAPHCPERLYFRHALRPRRDLGAGHDLRSYAALGTGDLDHHLAAGLLRALLRGSSGG